MAFRIAHLNMEKDHRRRERRPLVAVQVAALRPDIFTMNEIGIAAQTRSWMQDRATERLGHRYALVQNYRITVTVYEIPFRREDRRMKLKGHYLCSAFSGINKYSFPLMFSL